jgi:hypothetical protein
MYMETEVKLDSLDIRNLLTLVEGRMAELNEFKAKHGEESIPAHLADEQLYNYRQTRKRLRAGLADIKIKAATNGGRQSKKPASRR